MLLTNKMKKNQNCINYKSILSYSLVVFLSLFYVWSLYSANTSNSKQESNDVFVIHLTENATVSYYNPYHLPFKKSSESEAPTENETEDNFDEDVDHLIEKRSCKNQFFSAFKEQTLFQLKQSLENRTTVSLLILYHSWKSFLI
ncbi:MAG: hypothetical protein CMD31_01780 [Flavobacteriales bacterium]|mgnify:CR=1 FL=1|nr:hypothetical protein [Flavobacteriales bacterium]